MATDYLGYAKSAYSCHPYLHADSGASSVIDSIRAARKAAAARSINLSGKVMDLLGWNPKARTLLCGGAGDPTVPPALHRDVAQADFTNRGLTNVTSVDVDSQVQATFGVAGKAPPTRPLRHSRSTMTITMAPTIRRSATSRLVPCSIP